MSAGFRRSLRLNAATQRIYFSHAFRNNISCRTSVTALVHRFEESIAGRPYLIEVVAVSQDRWRADIVRIPRVPTALMPFYGSTPTEAAQHLCDWLTRAYARASKPAGSV